MTAMVTVLYRPKRKLLEIMNSLCDRKVSEIEIENFLEKEVVNIWILFITALKSCQLNFWIKKYNHFVKCCNAKTNRLKEKFYLIGKNFRPFFSYSFKISKLVVGIFQMDQEHFPHCILIIIPKWIKIGFLQICPFNL